MPMEHVRLSEAITKAELHQRFRDWLQNTTEHIIGPEATDGRTAWVHIQDEGSNYVLHADTNRLAVEEYMQLVARYGDNVEWHTVNNKRGRPNAVAFGPGAVRLTHTLYLYLLDTD